LCGAPRHTPTPSHGDDRSHAITTAAPLSCQHNSPSHRVRRSARGGDQLLSATDLDLHLLWGPVLQCRLIDLLEVRRLFLSSCRTVVGLTCNTRAVSRMPLAFIAMSTSCCLTPGKRPA